MRHMSRIIVIVATLLAGVASQAWAQDALTANIPFSFVVMNTTQPPGTYEFHVTDRDEAIEFNSRGQAGGIVGIVMRLGQPEMSNRTLAGRLVFDKVGDQRILSEVWLPGAVGFLVHAESATHTHETVSGGTHTGTDQ